MRLTWDDGLVQSRALIGGLAAKPDMIHHNHVGTDVGNR